MRAAIAGLAAALLALPACQHHVPADQPATPPMSDFRTEKFYLSAAPASADGYPTRLIEGYFKRFDGQTFHVPSGYYIAGSWGASGTAEVSGDEHQPAPDSLYLQWFSYAEDKFYEGHFQLPQRRMYDWLKAGWYNNDKRKTDTYDELTVCLVPGGVAVVWLGGDQMKQLVGRYQAQAIPYDWRVYSARPETRAQTMHARRAEMSPAVRAQIAAGQLSSARWDAYLVKYPWKVEVLAQTGLADQRGTETLTLYRHYIRYLSAEQDTYPAANTKPAQEAFLDHVRQHMPKAVPRVMGLFVQNKYGERHEIRIDPFDEAETLAAFQTLHARHPQEPIVLRVLVDKLYTQVALSLSNGFQTLPLDKATVKHFEE